MVKIRNYNVSPLENGINDFPRMQTIDTNIIIADPRLKTAFPHDVITTVDVRPPGASGSTCVPAFNNEDLNCVKI